MEHGKYAKKMVNVSAPLKKFADITKTRHGYFYRGNTFLTSMNTVDSQVDTNKVHVTCNM